MGNSIIDLIIRIKNGYLVKKQSIHSPYSYFKEEILKKLSELHFIKKYELLEKNNKKYFIIDLLYSDEVPAFTDVKIESKPGQRIYISYKKLKNIMGGLGYSLISTSKGIMTNKEAKKAKLGGELLFIIW